MSASLRVALFTPLPPARTGIAEYAQSLIPELAKLVRLQVFESVPKRVNWAAFDVAIYQVANNPWHSAIYRLALDHPGIAVLHEPNLHELIRGLTFGTDGEKAYLDEVVYEIFGREHSNPHEIIGIDLPSGSLTMARRLLDRSAGCVVHSHYAEREVRLKRYWGPLTVIPHGSEPRCLDVHQYRQSLGVPIAAPLIGLFGYHRPDKREMEGLRVFERLLKRYPNAHLVVVGEPHPEVPMQTWVEGQNLGRQVHQLGYLPLADFDAYLAACDVVVNLRHPTCGETSGTMMRAFGLGRTVVVSDTGSCQELPDEVCVRIPADVHEEDVLFGVLEWLLDHPLEAASIGGRAREWVAAQCTWSRVASRYAEFAQSVAQAAAPAPTANGPVHSGKRGRAEAAKFLTGWVEPDSGGGADLQTHLDRLVRTLELIPAGGPNERILEMGCYMQLTPAFGLLLGYGEVRAARLGRAGETERERAVSASGEVFECSIDLFNAEVDRFPYPDAYFSTVICCELLEHLERDPMHMMWEIHRVLRPGGVLLLSTPNIVSLRSLAAALRADHPALYPKYGRVRIGKGFEPGHLREYTPEEIRLLLAESGFVVVDMSTEPYGEMKGKEDPGWVRPVLQGLGVSTDLRGDCIFAIARSGSAPRKRYPDWLYTI